MKKKSNFCYLIYTCAIAAKTNAILEKRCCKKNTVRFIYSSNDKIIFALPTEVIARHIIIIFINVKKAGFKKCPQKLSEIVGLAFIIAQIISYISSFV